MRYQVKVPQAGFTGDVVGITFRDGLGEVDAATDHGQAAYQFFQRHGYGLTPLDEPDQEQQSPPPVDFDPGEHNVPEVLEHLQHADHAEALRVLDAEAAGKARAGIVSTREQVLASKEGSAQ